MFLDVGKLLSAVVKSPQHPLIFLTHVGLSFSKQLYFIWGLFPSSWPRLSGCLASLCVVVFSWSAHEGPGLILASNDSRRCRCAAFPVPHPRVIRSLWARLFLELLVYGPCSRIARDLSPNTCPEPSSLLFFSPFCLPAIQQYKLVHAALLLSLLVAIFC